MLRIFRLQPLLLMSWLSLALLGMLLFYPVEGVNAAIRGILIWWDVLFPALFPFFVISELMLGFGLVHFFGSLLDPVMRPLFRVPGIGGFILTIGFASGYPVGARLTSQLWEQKLVTREEGERLVAFTTTSDPIFLIGAVSVGFFHDPRLAVILGVAHYGTALLVGILMRFHGGGAMSGYPAVQAAEGRLLKRSFEAMHAARLADGRPFGLMLQQAVRSGIQLVFVVGGLVVFFSAVLAMLSAVHLLENMHAAADTVLHTLGFPAGLAESVVGGLFEVTLGSKAAGGAAASIPMVYKVAMGAFILSWAGLSVHAQIVSLLHKTNLRYTPFLFARVLHGILSAAAVLLLWDVLKPDPAPAAGVLSAFAQAGQPEALTRYGALPGSILSFVLLTAALALLASLHHFHIKINEWHGKI
ncbi:sporulation integral membrane protein YlbJ [Gorillibacterium sp. sgz5001074]|uniref:sporulation integral membrane protein YlbJ n=1 Tax=Gorillibacterium sp. sgz5001074 TaxID=3446695 RepID=UPI003F66AA04